MAIYISEVDKTSAESLNPNTFTVLVPGFAELKEGKSGTLVSGSEIEFEKVEDLEEAFEDYNIENNLSYKMAYHYLKLGLPVLYVVINSKEELENSDSGGEGFWKKYTDKSLYDLRFITAGEFSSKKIAENAIECAALRGDAVAVVDVPDEGTESAETIDLTAEYVDEWVNNLNVGTITRENGVKEDPFGYGAVFAPKISFLDPYFEDEDNEYPGSFAYIVAFAYHRDYPEWFPTAGSIRGVLPFSNVKVSYPYGTAAESLLQARILKTDQDYHRASNLIEKVRPYGNIIWGARTLYPLKVEGNKVGLKASSFLNIRQLCCSLKKTLYAASRRFTFEPNTDILWTNFKAAVKPLLEEMKSNQGIKGYEFVKEETKQKATLKATINIIPVEPVEDFDLTVYMTDSITEVTISE